jgi:small-conductance mechanosensitive channel
VWNDAWTDLGIPGMRWQILTLAVCFALGWGTARLVRRVISRHEVHQDVMRLGVESFVRVLSPLLTLALIALAKPVLARFDHVDLLRVAIPLVGSFALIRLAFYVMRRVFARRGPAGGMIVLFEKTFALMVWIVVALHITGTLPDILDYLDNTVVHLGRNKVSVLEILQAALSVSVTLIVALWVSALLEERLMRLDSMHSSLRVVLSRLGRAILVLVAILVSLSLVGIDLTVLSVFGGALGVGLGLGLQKIASSYVSGFVILFERSLSIGDVVSVDKFSGRVTQINTRYTVIRGGDGGETVVPNEMLVSSPVQNFSLTDKGVQLVVRITVDYRTDIDLALRLLEETALDIEHIDQTLERKPQAFMVKFATDGIDLEMNLWLDDLASGKNLVLSNVNRAVWRVFQEHEINVPFPQREIRLIDEQSIGKKDDVNMPKPAVQGDLSG